MKLSSKERGIDNAVYMPPRSPIPIDQYPRSINEENKMTYEDYMRKKMKNFDSNPSSEVIVGSRGGIPSYQSTAYMPNPHDRFY